MKESNNRQQGQSVTICPHCHEPMSAWRPPEGSAWDEPFQLVCFNDLCPYYVRGWKWMSEHFSAKASYRHRLNPATGQTSPLPVWSPTALKDRIIMGTDSC